MFNPTGIAGVAPKSAPFLVAIGADLDAFVQGLRATNGTTKSAVLAIIKLFATSSARDDDLGRNCGAMFGPGQAAAFIALMDAGPLDDTAPTEVEAMIAVGNLQMDSATVWVCDLVNGSKKKMIDGSNVEGYFASFGRSDVKGAAIASLINKATNFLPDNISDAGFRNSLTRSVWNSYHISRVATGKLLKGVREPFIELGIYQAEDEDDTAINQSADNPWNVELSHNISKKIVGYASIFFEVSGKDVGDWKQGRKALDDVPAARIKAVKAIFKQYIDVKNNIGAIEETTTVQGLLDEVPNGFF